MNDGLIPARYAKALFKYAEEQGKTAQVYEQMKRLEASFADVDSLQSSVDNPYLPAKDKERVLLVASGSSEGECVDKFIKLVLKNNRVDNIRSMALAYQAIYRKANKIEKVVISTASKIADEELEKIQAIVKNYRKGMELEFETQIDSELIGGFTVRLESTLLDASIKNELKKLRLKLLS